MVDTSAAMRYNYYIATEEHTMDYDIRDFALEMVDDGHADARDMLLACIKYMSTDAVKDMLQTNEYATCEDDIYSFVDEDALIEEDGA
tara:strand:- start:8 stop:271 length:264 start_codon:yes stop_codon:yes gene_type:complete